MRHRRHIRLLRFTIALLTVSACSPEIHEAHKKPVDWKNLDIKGSGLPSDTGAGKSPPFGCDSRDLINFTCE